MGRERPRVLVVAICLLLAASLAGPLVGPSRAAAAQSGGSSRLVLTHLTPAIGPGAGTPGEGVDSLTLRVLLYLDRDDATLTDVDLVVETFGRTTSRSRLHQALGGDVTSVRQIVQREELVGSGGTQPGEVVGAEVVLAADRIAIGGQAGVYPIQLSVVQGTTVLDQLVTAAVYLDEQPVNPLRTVMVWPIVAPPAATLSGAADAATLAQLLPGGRLSALLSAAEETGAQGLVVEVAPHLLEALATTVAIDDAPDVDTASGGGDGDVVVAATSLERLRALVATAPFAPVTGPQADADLSALVTASGELGALAGRLASGARDDLVRLTGRTPEPTSFLSVAPLSPAALDLLPGQHLLVPYDHVEGPDPQLDSDLPSPTRTVRGASGRELVATVADPHVAARLAQPDLDHGPVSAVQEVLVEAAMIYFERPGVAERPLLMLPPRDWSPSEAYAHRLATLLPSTPWLQLIDSVGLTESVGLGDAPAEGAVSATVPGVPQATVNALVRTVSRLATAQEILVDGGTAIDGIPADSLQAAVARATSAAWAERPAVAAELLEEVEARVDAAYGSIEVPTGSGITLTAEEVPIPVTIRRVGGEALRVEVEVVSRGSLDFPNGSVQQLVLQPDSNQTVSFVARSRSRGTLPVTVIVRSPAGEREFTRASLTVNSQVVSRPALIAVAAVVVLLLLLGRRRRRPGGRSGGELVVVPGGEADADDPAGT